MASYLGLYRSLPSGYPEPPSCFAEGAQPATGRTAPLPTRGNFSHLSSLGPVALGEEFIAANPKVRGFYPARQERMRGKVWGRARLLQFRRSMRLLQKAVPGRAFASLTQADLLYFFELLTRLPPDFHCSPTNRLLSLEQICARAHLEVTRRQREPESIGLCTGTINNRMILLRQAHTWLARQLPVHAIYWHDFIFRDVDRKRARERGYSLEQIEAIFRLPIWTGRHKSRGRLKPGRLVYHDAAYWVPLLCWYTAARREELCGLLVDDVRLADGIWHLRLIPNAYRSLKTPASERNLPLHPELLRLGFLEYVSAIGRKGHELLFPELLGPPRSPGDVFYDRSWKYIALALPWLKGGQAMHAFRHAANNALKSVEVFSEKRRDFLGQSGASEAETRYAQPTSLAELRIVVEKLPVMTAHLQRKPLRLLRAGYRAHRAPQRRPRHPVTREG